MHLLKYLQNYQADKQQEFLNAYYNKEKGIGYSLIRTNIHSCDFSSGSYTYVDEGDKDLKSFSIQHDKQFRIPLIKKAIETAGGNLLFYASPWSPPAFMKDNNNMLKRRKTSYLNIINLGQIIIQNLLKLMKAKEFLFGELLCKMNLWQHKNGNPVFLLLKKKEIF
jgi:hypothetical protein